MGKAADNNEGVIVNIGSLLGLINTPIAPIYNSTKHAVVSFVRSMKVQNIFEKLLLFTLFYKSSF